MAYSLNRAQLIGNLTSDPELRQIPSGRTVATFSIATNSSWTDANGQRQDKAEFHNIVCWGKLAEIVGQYLKKGRKVYAEGKLQTRNWEGEDGVKRYKTEIVADNVIMLDRGAESPNGAPGGYGSAPMQNSAPTPAAPAAPKPAASTPQSAEIPTISADTPTGPTEDEVTIDDLPF